MKIAWDSDFGTVCARYAHRRAVTDTHRCLTYRQLFAEARAVSAYLIQQGVAAGQPVATLFSNSTEAVCASIGVTLAGAAEVTLNPHLSDSDLADALKLSTAKHLVTNVTRIRRLPNGHVHRLHQIVTGDVDSSNSFQRPAEDDWGRILFTSGTTGMPKAVVHSHGRRWLANVLLRLSLEDRPGLGDTLLVMTPFAHGASLLTYAFLSQGAEVCLRDGVDVEGVSRLIAGGRVNSIFAPPTVLSKLAAPLRHTRVNSLRTIYTGTAPLAPELYRQVRDIFGPIVRVTYGMTEHFNPIAVMEPSETDAWYESTVGSQSCVGWPRAGVEVAICDDEGEPVESGITGNVLIRTRHGFVGYITALGYERADDGFYETGDVGHWDPVHGLVLSGRKHDIIKTGGYKIYPEEVEAGLRKGGLDDRFAIFSIPSQYWGEIVSVALEGTSQSWAERLEGASATLTPYKRPRLAVHLANLPQSSTGKINRHDIRKTVLAGYRLVDGPHPVLEPRST